MLNIRRRLRSFTWIALLAMLGLALAPTVSHALAAAGGSGGFNPWAEICSAAGAKFSAAATDTAANVTSAKAQTVPGQPAKSTQALHFEHCPLCGQASHSPALPPGEVAVVSVPDGANFFPALFAQSPRPLFAWASAQPRGPPATS